MLSERNKNARKTPRYMKGKIFRPQEVNPMYRNPSDREVAKNPKKPVSVNRLKKVVSASIESIRILSEILWKPP